VVDAVANSKPPFVSAGVFDGGNNACSLWLDSILATALESVVQKAAKFATSRATTNGNGCGIERRNGKRSTKSPKRIGIANTWKYDFLASISLWECESDTLNFRAPQSDIKWLVVGSWWLMVSGQKNNNQQITTNKYQPTNNNQQLAKKTMPCRSHQAD
jgi:hypothetical protein